MPSAHRRHACAGSYPPGSTETKSDVGSGKPTAKHNGRGAQTREPGAKVKAGCFDFYLKRRCHFFSKSACVGRCPGRIGVAISARWRARQLRKCIPDISRKHGCAGGSPAASKESKSAVEPERPEAKQNGRGSQAGKHDPKVDVGCYAFCMKRHYRIVTKSASVGGRPRHTGVAISDEG